MSVGTMIINPSFSVVNRWRNRCLCQYIHVVTHILSPDRQANQLTLYVTPGTFKSPKVLSPRNRRNSAAKTTVSPSTTAVTASRRDMLHHTTTTTTATMTQVLQPSPSVARYAGDRCGMFSLRLRPTTLVVGFVFDGVTHRSIHK